MSKSKQASAKPPTPNLNPTPNPSDPAVETLFDHEKLDVYQDSIAFCAWAGELIEGLPRIAVRDQLDRASTSIPLNIAEGNAKFSLADRSRFFEISRGSAVECAACLDVLVARKLTTSDQILVPKRQLAGIVRMLVGLLRRFSPRADVLQEESAIYDVFWEKAKE
jgi:four helix bundle protein